MSVRASATCWRVSPSRIREPGGVRRRHRPDRLRLRLHQRLSRFGELDRHDRRDARPEPLRGRHLGRLLQLLGGVRGGHRRREDGPERNDRSVDRRSDRYPVGVVRRNRLEPHHLGLRPSLQLLARAHRRLRRRSHHESRLDARSSGATSGSRRWSSLRSRR